MYGKREKEKKRKKTDLHRYKIKNKKAKCYVPFVNLDTAGEKKKYQQQLFDNDIKSGIRTSGVIRPARKQKTGTYQ